MATWKERQAAEEELSRLAGAPSQATRITNEAQAAARDSAHPSQAMEGTTTSPGWASYLAGIQQVQQARPDQQPGALPVAGGTPTLARQQFEESVRQFNEQMAFKRAVEAARQAAAARSARMSSAPQAGAEIDEQSMLWQHLRGVVDRTVEEGGDWSDIRGYMAREYGDIQRYMPFEEAEQAAFTYYDQRSHPSDQPWHDPAPEPQQHAWYDPRGWFGGTPEQPAPEPQEDIDRLRRAFYGDRYDQEW